MVDDSPPTSPVAARQGPATENRAHVQAEVLEATSRLLAAGNAYADLSVQRIAKESGISRTAFYFYFADKRDLVMKLAEDISRQLYEQAADFFTGQADSEAELRSVLTNVYDLYRQHGALTRAIVEVSTYDEEIAVFWRSLLDAFVSATEQRIEHERAANGSDRAGRPGARPMAFALTWMVERTMYQQLVQDEPIAREDVIEAMVEVFLGAQ